MKHIVDYGDIIESIKTAMVNQRITQSQLANRVEVSEWALSRYLTGQRKMPFNVMVGCLEALGYKVMVVKEQNV